MTGDLHDVAGAWAKERQRSADKVRVLQMELEAAEARVKELEAIAEHRRTNELAVLSDVSALETRVMDLVAERDAAEALLAEVAARWPADVLDAGECEWACWFCGQVTQVTEAESGEALLAQIRHDERCVYLRVVELVKIKLAGGEAGAK